MRLASTDVPGLRTLARPVRRAGRHAAIAAARASARLRRADVAVFHEFVPPPFGGGNQFMLNLVGELERRGLRVERNTISATSRACLFNSYNFDFDRLERLARDGVRMVHRVDGPLQSYRGFDDGTDDRIAAINRIADATVFQSRYSLEQHVELGYELVEPVVVTNAPDPRIFHPRGREPFSRDRPVRLIASSWSGNPRKGGETYRRLAESLDPARFEFVFVGTASVALPHAIPPVAPDRLADLLRRSDVYVAASENDPCSNAVLEALACGLPVVYRRSGGHPELVGDAGLGFEADDEISELVERLIGEYEERVASIRVRDLAEVCDAYLTVLGVDAPR
jgi:glycosyltransferase involved in cell wall biosynthesis